MTTVCSIPIYQFFTEQILLDINIHPSDIREKLFTFHSSKVWNSDFFSKNRIFSALSNSLNLFKIQFPQSWSSRCSSMIPSTAIHSIFLVHSIRHLVVIFPPCRLYTWTPVSSTMTSPSSSSCFFQFPCQSFQSFEKQVFHSIIHCFLAPFSCHLLTFCFSFSEKMGRFKDFGFWEK